jgi:hypothetical protein
MQTESVDVSRDLLTAYVDEEIQGLSPRARNSRLGEIRIELARDIDGGEWDGPSTSVVRAFLADFDTLYPVVPEPPAAPKKSSTARQVRRGLLQTMPRLLMILMALSGAARTGGVRHVGIALLVIIGFLIIRSAYLSSRAGAAATAA